MLLANIYSIIQSNPDSRITVFWQDIEERFIRNIIKAFKHVTFIETNFDLTTDPIKKISSKTLFWNYAAQIYPHNNICFLDVDTLVIKNIGHFFEKDFDIVFTYKDDQFPLNTGVMLCKSDKYPLFFQRWEEDTFKIITSPDLNKKANSPEYPYGGADQMSFYEMLRYNSNQTEYFISTNGQKLLLKGLPCEILNETGSKPITKSTHIIHYKGGWQPILIDGKNFSKIRNKNESWEMYILYLKTFLESLNLLNNKSNKYFEPKDLNITIPFYINRDTLKERKWAYLLYSYYDRLKRRLKK
ncbi:MAG: hypothetical protein ISS45_07305 [Candidatus Omnitrophica bacterium]|nr:hypothetical protein [Candidatus Omnitrophota bacterium]